MTTLNTVYVNLGSIVRSALVAKSQTQRALGRRLGISESTVQRRLSGDVPFNVTELMMAAKWLGESASDCLDWLKRAGMDDLAPV